MLGDFNARLKDLSIFDDTEHSISYAKNLDSGVNQNGKDFVDLCLTCELKPINHLTYRNKQFDGKLTFKQSNTWISQLDWAVVSQTCLSAVCSFAILQEAQLPTNHAPLALCINHPDFCATELLQRATLLGSVTVTGTGKSHSRPVRMENIDLDKFVDNIPAVDSL
jgi:hypothetical protein